MSGPSNDGYLPAKINELSLDGISKFPSINDVFFGTVLAESLLIGDIDDIHSIMHGSKRAP